MDSMEKEVSASGEIPRWVLHAMLGCDVQISGDSDVVTVSGDPAEVVVAVAALVRAGFLNGNQPALIMCEEADNGLEATVEP